MEPISKETTVQKKSLIPLSLTLAACTCLIPAWAADSAKVASLAPAGDLVAEANAKIESLDKALADNDSYLKAQKKQVPQDAGVLAVLAQGIAEHSETTPLKPSAPALRDAAVELSKATSFDAAKKAFDKVKAAQKGGAGAGAKPQGDWAKLVDFDALMREVTAGIITGALLCVRHHK